MYAQSSSPLVDPTKEITSDQSTNEDAEQRIVFSHVISAAKVDPFNCWPITWHRKVNENFEYLTKSFGPSMFGYLPNDNDFDIFKTQTQLALEDPAAFHALMVVSTMRKDRDAGKTLPGISFLWHRLEAIRIVKERLQRGDVDECTTQGSIYAVMCLMGIGRQWNAVDVNEFNPESLNHLIVLKGGLKVISEEHPVLETSLFGMAVINPGLLRSDLYTANDLAVLERDQDSRMLLYSLLGFFRASAALKEKKAVVLSQVQQKFAPGTAMYNLLNVGHHHPGIHDGHQHRLSSRLIAHVASYVLCILIYASPSETLKFLQHLDFVAQHVHIWRNSLRMFAWAVVCNIESGSLMFSMQAWQSYEMLRAGIHMPYKLRYEALSCLVNIVTGQAKGPDEPNAIMTGLRSVIFQAAPPGEQRANEDEYSYNTSGA